jgi:hypothetical protein
VRSWPHPTRIIRSGHVPTCSIEYDIDEDRVKIPSCFVLSRRRVPSGAHRRSAFRSVTTRRGGSRSQTTSRPKNEVEICKYRQYNGDGRYYRCACIRYFMRKCILYLSCGMPAPRRRIGRETDVSEPLVTFFCVCACVLF